MKYTNLKKIKASKLYKELEKLNSDIYLEKQNEEYFCQVNLHTNRFGINYIPSFIFSEEDFMEYVNNFDIDEEAILLKTTDCGYPSGISLIDTIKDIQECKETLIEITKKL